MSPIEASELSSYSENLFQKPARNFIYVRFSADSLILCLYPSISDTDGPDVCLSVPAKPTQNSVQCMFGVLASRRRCFVEVERSVHMIMLITALHSVLERHALRQTEPYLRVELAGMTRFCTSNCGNIKKLRICKRHKDYVLFD